MALPPYASGIKSLIVEEVTAETEGALTDLVELSQEWAEGTEPGGPGTKSAKGWTDRAAVLAYLASNPFADTTALNAYSNSALADGMTTTIKGDGEYDRTGGAWVRRGDDAVKRAEDAATASAASATTSSTNTTLVRKVTGQSDADIVTYTIGDSSLDSSNLGATVARSTGLAFPRDVEMGPLEVRLSAAAVLTVYIVEPTTRAILKKFDDLSGTTGLNTFAASTFGGYIRPANSLLFVERKSGTGSIRGASGPGITVPIGPYAEGATLAAFTVAVSAPAIEATGYAVPKPINDRLDEIEDYRDYAAVMVSRSIGDAPANIGLATLGTYVATQQPMMYLNAKRCFLTSLSMRVNAATVGFLDFWQDQADGTVKRYMSYPVQFTASGETTFTFDNLPLREHTFVGLRVLAGGSMQGYNPGGVNFNIVYANLVGDTAPLVINATSFYPAVRATMLEERRDIITHSRSDSGSITPILRTSFAGTSDSRWTLTSPWTINNGLSASGAGSWTTTAYFYKSSNTHKRRHMARVRVGDPTTISGICTVPMQTNRAAGTAAIIDCVAGKLRHYAYSNTTAILLGETNLPAAILAKIASSTAFEAVISIEKNDFTTTLFLGDPVTGQTATITHTFGANGGEADNAYRSLMHGRPGFVHLQGAMTVKWAHAFHRFPRDGGILLQGDSNAEGTAVFLNDGGSSYAQKAAAASSRVIMSAMAGSGFFDLFERRYDVLDFNHRAVFVNIGTNDSTSTTLNAQRWAASVCQFAEMIEATGAECVLINPNPGNSSTITDTNNRSAAFDNGWFGRRRIVDFTYPVSPSNNRNTIDKPYSGGGVHINNAGQNLVYAQLQLEAPDVLL